MLFVSSIADASTPPEGAAPPPATRRAARESAGLARSSFRPDVQGLRAIAVLAVILYHAGLPVPGGFAGVDVFFVISGFVITAMLEREMARNGKISFLRFYQRRFKRLTPALAVVVIVTMVASALLLTSFGQQQIAAKTGIGAMVFVANLVIAKGTGGYFDPAASTNPLLHTWSLSVEEQFYFAFPLLFAIARRFGRPILVTVVTGVAALSLFAAIALPTEWPLGFYSPVTRAWEFGLGALLALAAHRAPRSLAAPAGITGLVLLIAGFFIIDDVRWPGAWTLLPAVATALCIVAGTPGAGTNPATRLLGSSPLVTVGNYSYSLYLWHWPFISLMSNWLTGSWVGPLAAVLSIAPAVLSYRLVEERFRTRPLAGPRQWIPAVALAMTVPMLCSAALYVGQKKNWGSDTIAALSTRTGTHPGWDDCLRLDTGGTGARQIDRSKCTFGTAKGGPTTYLVGDSNAAMYSDPALATAEKLRGQLVVRTAAGCPLADTYRSSGGAMTSSDRACRDFVEQTLAELEKAPKNSVVFLAEAPSQWLLPGRGYSSEPTGFRDDFEGRRTALTAGFDKTLSALRARGLHPVLIEPMVTFPDGTTHNSVVSCRTTLSILDGACPSPASLGQEDPHNRQVRDDIKKLAAETSTPLVPIAARQCPKGSCAPTVEGAPVLMDNGHFSAAFTRRLGEDFTTAAARATLG